MRPSQKQDGIPEYAAWLIKHKAKQLIGKAGYTSSDQADLEQEMFLDLIGRLPKFDPSKATSKTFIARIVEHKISNLIRHRTSEMRDFRLEAGSLNHLVEDGDGNSVEFGDLIAQEDVDVQLGRFTRDSMEEKDFLHDMETTLAGLPENLRRLCELLATGTISDAARKAGIPRTTLHDQVKRLRAIFEDAGLQNYL
jgi:RNA polymerase sigma-70 factor, ECF subfamily